MEELIAFLRARLDEDSLWATEASRPNGQSAVEGGVHWQWEDPEADEVITPTPDRDEFVGGEDRFRVSLRSRETWPTPWASELPLFAIPSAEEIPSAVGGHIVRHDPARVLAEVDAKRRILDECAYWIDKINESATAKRPYPNLAERGEVVLPVITLLGLPYASHPDYRDEWRP